MTREMKEKRGEYIIKAITELSLGGDTYHSKQAIRIQSLKRNHVFPANFENDYDYLVQQGLLHQAGDRIYLKETWQYECFVANRICEIMQVKKAWLTRVLPAVFKVNGKQLTAEQRSAVMLALNHPLSMILGGAGTGKTTLIEAIVQHSPVAFGCGLCAPTGKAARNLSERNNLPAATVYSMLRMTPDNHMLDARPLEDTSLVIVDEASMLTLKEFAGILEAAGPGGKVVLLGDPNQLLSVGSGNIVPDLLALGVSSIHLSTCHRQAGEERALLHNVRSFKDCHSINDLMFDETFEFVSIHSSEMLLQHLADEGARLYLKKESIQVVAPTNNMVYDLNRRIQEKHNPATYDADGNPLELEIYDKRKRSIKLRDGDRIMMLRNNYDLNYSNGDTGILHLTNYDDESLAYHVVFPDGRTCSWNNKSGLRDMTLAYAITIHKSQGSEYDTILMPVTRSRMLNRNLIYTAISRAKNRVELVGDMEALDFGLRTLPEPRKSGLVERVVRLRDAKASKLHVA